MPEGSGGGSLPFQKIPLGGGSCAADDGGGCQDAGSSCGTFGPSAGGCAGGAVGGLPCPGPDVQFCLGSAVVGLIPCSGPQ